MCIIKKIWKIMPVPVKRILIFVLIKLPIIIKEQLYRMKIKRYTKKLLIYKNIAEGKRCFIIGNGPSLTVEDLELLKDEDCFAVNRIFRLFQRTKWRPTYYCCQDEVLLDDMSDEIESAVVECKEVLLSGYLLKNKKSKYPEKTCFFYLNKGPFPDDVPLFSEDITKELFEGFTVLYACIQIAVYMGYKEIYLLGVDHNYMQTKDNEYDGSNSYAKGLEVDMTKLNPPQLNKSQKAYEVAERYCREHQIIIKNVTRGGKLEVFERAKLENILRK